MTSVLKSVRAPKISGIAIARCLVVQTESEGPTTRAQVDRPRVRVGRRKTARFASIESNIQCASTSAWFLSPLQGTATAGRTARVRFTRLFARHSACPLATSVWIESPAIFEDGEVAFGVQAVQPLLVDDRPPRLVRADQPDLYPTTRRARRSELAEGPGRATADDVRDRRVVRMAGWCGPRRLRALNCWRAHRGAEESRSTGQPHIWTGRSLQL